jgi:hypothetical protein
MLFRNEFGRDLEAIFSSFANCQAIFLTFSAIFESEISVKIEVK